MGWARKTGIGLGGSILLIVAAGFGLDWADRAFPPPLDAAKVVSTEVRDQNDQLLRAFATPDGTWRLKTTAKDVDPQFLRMLIAYEDQRFYDHDGIDPLALLRAAGQLIGNGRIVSGGSTLTMQVARLLEPRGERSLLAKLRQMARAIQIERRLSKAEIVDLYLQLAPYGGNLEGVRAASLAYFGKEPHHLSVGESALLVALPQLPEARRPDRHPENARRARDRVLNRLAVVEVIGDGEFDRAQIQAMPTGRMQLPALAAHLSETARRKKPGETVLKTTLRRDVQKGLEAVAAEESKKLGPRVSIAMVMADARTGEILGEVGSANYFESGRSGWIDMTRVLRSPGSTLKPFVYGLAFEQGLVAQETIIEDRPSDFSGYRPRNFDMSYMGDVSVRQALQMSLNVPAVRLLSAVGPSRLMVRLRRSEVRLKLPENDTPGLSIALGGAGITLKDLVQLYAGLANRGHPVRLGDGVNGEPAQIEGDMLLDPVAAWNVTDTLSAVLPPAGAKKLGIAYKTGTSYGYRDAWSVGYDGQHVLGVWVGRADNGAVPGIAGYKTAAPILFEAFQRSGVGIVPFAPPPAGAVRPAATELPPSLKRFSMTENGLVAANAREAPPQIVYPPEGARVDLGLTGAGPSSPLVLKMQGGRAPFRWLANGKPLPELTRRRTSQWMPDGGGFSTLTVIDAAGKASSVRVFLD
ncbi:penicillin-binding protein 1C [Gellertiella hungarica]|uniref:peptidoglycan glycosyltransferase n=1 Tax=Gellertiella hungarica TaxID=1572859 RepID=A0A7W6J595_9HYPH|nr:penicillin-binding protein 1C [Gellertiella hungarica]MBB4065024.1 penicillin-binding protein 1C [Gellertiella hungarica]